MEKKKNKPKYSTVQNFSYIIKNLWQWDKKLFFLSLVQIPTTVSIPLLSIYLPKIVIDSVLKHVTAIHLIFNVGTVILFIIMLNVILSFSVSISDFSRISYRFKYWEMLNEKALDTDYENIESPSGQNKFTKANMCVYSNDSATETAVKASIEFFSNILGFILYAGIISSIHPLIVVFLIVSSLVNYFVGRYVSSFEHKNKDNLAPIEKKLNYIVKNTGEFKSAKDMRLYNMFPWFKSVFVKLQKEKIYYTKKNISRRYFANLVDGALIFLRDGITYGYLIYLVLYKNLSVSNFVLFFGAVSGFSVWLSGIVKNINSLNSTSLNICDLREYLEMEDNMNRGKGVELPKAYEMPVNIELKNLYFKYEGAEDYTIKNLNLMIKKGEKLALVGVNGAGKTTLVKLICGLYAPTNGEIIINGKKSSLYNRDEYYTLFSVVFQDLHLLPVSIEKNITLLKENEIDEEKLNKVLKLSGFIDKVSSLPKGIKTRLVKSVYEDAIDLSGGEMQKLMLSRALYKNAPIIILDEPTAALDPIAENEIYVKYNELTYNHTSIFISHRLSSTRFCDRIIFLDKGQVVEEGTHESLMAKGGKYKKMYEMQSYYYKNNIGGEIDA